MLVEAPPLGVLVQEAELFASGWVSSVKVGQAMIQAMKIRHAVALGAFFVGSARQHEAIKHLASLRTEVGDGSVRELHSTAQKNERSPKFCLVMSITADYSG